MGQYERMPDQNAREADLLAGLRGRELCARLAGIDVEELYPHSSAVPLVADAADDIRQWSATGEEAFAEIEEPPAVADNPGDELFGIRDLAAVVEGACYWGGYLAGADPLDDPQLKPAMREGAARLTEAAGCRWWWSNID